MGDTLRYAVTRAGENPVFQGNRKITLRLQSSGHFKQLHRRVLSKTDQPLEMRRLNTDVVPTISERDGVTEMSLLMNDVEAHLVPDGTPGWRDWHARLVFSDMRNWRDVVDWALPMYAIDSQTPACSPWYSALRYPQSRFTFHAAACQDGRYLFNMPLTRYELAE